MGIIDKLGLTDAWNTNLNDKSSKYFHRANSLVVGIMTIFLIVFLVVLGLCVFLIWFLTEEIMGILPNIDLNEFRWLLYGVLFGAMFSFFVQAIPSKTGEDETPEKIWKSFRHHFSYFWAFFVSVIACVLIIMFLFAFVKIFVK